MQKARPLKIYLFIYLLFLSGIFLLQSCNDHMYPCKRKLYPNIKLVQFDTLEIDTLTVIKYYSLHSFDSIIESKMVFPLQWKYHNSTLDTFLLDVFFKSDPRAHGSISNSSFEVKFGNNRSIKIWDFSYYCKEENPRENGGNALPGDCLCEFVGCSITTDNCKFVMNKNEIIISP